MKYVYEELKTLCEQEKMLVTRILRLPAILLPPVFFRVVKIQHRTLKSSLGISSRIGNTDIAIQGSFNPTIHDCADKKSKSDCGFCAI